VKRDFALRIDCHLTGVRSALNVLVEHMHDHKLRGDLSDEEFKKYVQFIGRSMGETIKISDDLYRQFPDIVPDELIPEKDLSPELKKLRRDSD
jgi:hypothetical protein